jgi:hypothetical protein
MHLRARQWSDNAKKVVNALKEIVIKTSMHANGVGLERDDHP